MAALEAVADQDPDEARGFADRLWHQAHLLEHVVLKGGPNVLQALDRALYLFGPTLHGLSKRQTLSTPLAQRAARELGWVPVQTDASQNLFQDRRGAQYIITPFFCGPSGIGFSIDQEVSHLSCLSERLPQQEIIPLFDRLPGVRRVIVNYLEAAYSGQDADYYERDANGACHLARSTHWGTESRGIFEGLEIFLRIFSFHALPESHFFGPQFHLVGRDDLNFHGFLEDDTFTLHHLGVVTESLTIYKQMWATMATRPLALPLVKRRSEETARPLTRLIVRDDQSVLWQSQLTAKPAAPAIHLAHLPPRPLTKPLTVAQSGPASHLPTMQSALLGQAK